MATNYFDLLPDDIQTYIFEIRDNNCANFIIDKWYRYIDKKIIASQLLINILLYFNHTIIIDITNSHTVNVLEYCNKILTGNESYWWNNNFTIIENHYKRFRLHLQFKDLTGNEKINFNKITVALYQLKKKFKWQ